MSARFQSNLRLHQPAEFQRVFSGSQRFKSKYFALLARPNGLNYPRLGMSIAKKKVRNAVVRNRIKRVIRESFRLKQATLKDLDIVVVGYNGLADLTKSDLRKGLDELWKKLSK